MLLLDIFLMYLATLGRSNSETKSIRVLLNTCSYTYLGDCYVTFDRTVTRRTKQEKIKKFSFYVLVPHCSLIFAVPISWFRHNQRSETILNLFDAFLFTDLVVIIFIGFPQMKNQRACFL